MWYEEPLDPDDFLSQSILAESYVPSLATGENLFSKHGLQNMLRHGGLRPDRDWILLDPALSYGLTHYLQIIEMIESFGWSRRRLIPHGGHQLAPLFLFFLSVAVLNLQQNTWLNPLQLHIANVLAFLVFLKTRLDVVIL